MLSSFAFVADWILYRPGKNLLDNIIRMRPKEIAYMTTFCNTIFFWEFDVNVISVWVL